MIAYQFVLVQLEVPECQCHYQVVVVGIRTAFMAATGISVELLAAVMLVGVVVTDLVATVGVTVMEAVTASMVAVAAEEEADVMAMMTAVV